MSFVVQVTNSDQPTVGSVTISEHPNTPGNSLTLDQARAVAEACLFGYSRSVNLPNKRVRSSLSRARAANAGDSISLGSVTVTVRLAGLVLN